eukprot:6122512-Pyramimonas_sp.AAC.2
MVNSAVCVSSPISCASSRFARGFGRDENHNGRVLERLCMSLITSNNTYLHDLVNECQKLACPNMASPTLESVGGGWLVTESKPEQIDRIHRSALRQNRHVVPPVF